MEALPIELTSLLATRFGERFTTTQAVRDQHSGAGMHLPPLPPQAVAYAQTLEEIVSVAAACCTFKTPIIPYGAGTSLECHVGALRGGVCLDLSRMNQILRVSNDDQDCTVEAGVTRTQLNSYLRDTGLFFPVDPGADATLGGMAATRASGTTTVRYGGMRENVVALTVVTPEAQIIRTARRARKSAAGYDLTHLFVGAEGTLGIIADLTLRLHPMPEASSAAVVCFEDTASAVATVVETIQAGLPIARAEYLDAKAIDLVNRTFALSYTVADTLFLEFHGEPEEVERTIRSVETIAAARGGRAFQWAIEAEHRNALWRARHQAGFAAAASRPGCRPWSTDVCVPISHLAENILAAKVDLVEAPFPSVVLGHIGDGNFHAILLADPDNADEVAAAMRINQRIVARALASDGTCTGEHGVGVGKREALCEELGGAVGVMRAIKRALDPHDIMNPGKILLSA
ncbi:MAG: FAD-binding protein [Proteobacteria bacterium]|nr:FAD-binding protein [Pseudomonadota bacterium]